MRFATLLRMTALFTLGALTALCAPAQQTSPDQQTGDAVADAARKARAEQKTAPKPKKVFTNDDFASVKTPSDNTPKTDAAAKPGEKEPDGNAKPEDGGKGQAYWHGRFSAARAKLADAEKELDILQREQEKNQVQYYNDPQKALVQQYDRSDINDTNAKIDAKKKDVEKIRQQISDMEDELRKAGGDPGWAR
jgi:hypothetical protein